MPFKPKLTPRQIAGIDWSQTDTQIAARLHVTKEAIRQRRVKANKSPHPPGCPSNALSASISSVPKEFRFIAQHLRNSGETITRLCARANVSRDTIRNTLAGKTVPQKDVLERIRSAIESKNA